MAIINFPGTIPSVSDLKNAIPIGISPLGTPVFDDLTFDTNGYLNDDNTEVIRYEELKLQAVQLTVNQVTNMVKQQVQGRNGTIKTFTSKGDFVISVNAVLAELFNVPPYDQLLILKTISEAKEAIPVTCKFLNDYFDIRYVVIENITTSTVQGSLNTVNVSMSLVSDYDFDNDFNPKSYEIILKND